MRYKELYYFRQDQEHWILLEGKTQIYLARELGCSKSYINAVILGKSGCSKSFAYALTKCVSNTKTMDDLFIRKEK